MQKLLASSEAFEKIKASSSYVKICQAYEWVSELDQADFKLEWNLDRGLYSIQDLNESDWKPFILDFSEGALRERLVKSSVSKEFLRDALKIKNFQREELSLLDATGGWAQESTRILSWGYKTTYLERNPLVFELTRNAIEVAKQDDALQSLFSGKEFHMSLGAFAEDAKIQSKSFDLVYLDPIYPDRKSTALASKELRLLKNIVGSSSGELEEKKLFEEALRVSTKRVVIKRPRDISPMAVGRDPNHSVEGKSTRFDVYVVG